MGKYIRKAERIDKERGDVLQLPKQFLEPLYSSDYPVDARRDILDALVGWFIGREIPKLKNPLANAQLQGFINQQKEAVQSYLDLCRVNANNRARQPNEDGATTVPQGRRPSTAVGNKIKVNVKDKRSESFTVTDATVVVDGSGADADAAPEPPPQPTATEAKRQIQDIAPEVTKDNYDQAAIKFYKENYVGVWSENDRIAANRAALVVGETNNMQTVQFLIDSCRELGRELFLRAVFRMDRDLQKPGGSDIENPGAVLVTRLKKMQEAMAVLDAHMSTKSNPAPTCGSRG